MENSTDAMSVPREPENGWILEVSGEVYNELSTLLRGALSVSGAIKEIIPPHLALRLEGNLAKALSTLGRIEIRGFAGEPDSEREYDPVAIHNELLDRVHDQRVDRELEERAR